MKNVNGTLYFTARDNTSGYELWTSDGTPGGTLLVSDLAEGSSSSTPTDIAVVNGKLVVAASTRGFGRELYVGDPNASLTSLSIAATNASRPEGNSGTTALTFTVTRSGVTTGISTVRYELIGTTNTPASASDFVNGVLPRGTLTFAAGQTSKVITILVQGDTTAEATERFRVNLNTATGAIIGTSNANGVIVDDDSTASLALTTLGAFQDIKKRLSSAALIDRALSQL